MEARVKNRRLIVTNSGLIGLAPVLTQPGDVVIILEGHGIPVIARKLSTGAHGWNIIGEAFVNGMMDGEMMKRGIEQTSMVFV
jgi:hypothetical protein